MYGILLHIKHYYIDTLFYLYSKFVKSEISLFFSFWTRLKNVSSCPYRGARFDSCDCEPVDNIDAGLTSFQRIAINITSLSVLSKYN